jgi:N-methylhydantoinase A
LTNERIINQIRQVTVKRGYDPREFSFVAYGGAAPVHAGVIGERFEAPVLVPHAAGAFSAFGLMQSNIKYDLVQSLSQPLAPDTLNAIDNTYQELKSDARELQVEADIPKNHGDFVLTLETRYEGQVEEISQTIASVEELSVEMIEEAHHQQHETLYDFSDESWEIEVINVRLSIVGEIEGVGQVGAAGILPSKALKQERNVYFEQPGKFIETPIYAGEDGLSEPVEGPAIIELSHTTIVVPPGSTATYNNNGYYRIRSSVI